MWSDIETGLAITAGSLACLRPLVHLVTSKLGLSSVKTPHPNPDYSAGRKTPNISGPFNLVSFNKDSNWGFNGGGNEESFGPTYRDKNGDKDQWVTAHGDSGSEEHLRCSTPEAGMQRPPKAYAQSESLGGVGRYVHK